MSKEDVKKIRSAYESMLEDGSANKKVDMSMVTEPSVENIESGLGDKIEAAQSAMTKKDDGIIEEEHHNDYTEHDNYIDQRMNSLKTKLSEKKGAPRIKIGALTRANQEISSLKKRVEKLEEALMLVMETHEQLIG